MKATSVILLSCCVVFSFTVGVGKEIKETDSPSKPKKYHESTQTPKSESEKADVKKLLDDAAELKHNIPGKNVREKSSKKLGTDDTEDTASPKQLKQLVVNITGKINASEEEDVSKTTPYHARHYLTAEQKYYMLRLNLLGMGVKVVYDIIPIPVTTVEQYEDAMAMLLDKIQSARESTANMTNYNAHNISLENAHALHMKMTGVTTAKPNAEKKTNHTTEILIVVGAIVGIIALAALMWSCKRSRDKASESSYYDPLQPSVGGAMPMN